MLEPQLCPCFADPGAVADRWLGECGPGLQHALWSSVKSTHVARFWAVSIMLHFLPIFLCKAAFPATCRRAWIATGSLGSWKSRESVKAVQQWLRKFNPRMAQVLMDERDEARQHTQLPHVHVLIAIQSTFLSRPR